MSDLIESIKHLAIIYGMVVTLIGYAFYTFSGGQIECKACGWYNDYRILKPKTCARCRKSMKAKK